MERRQFVAAAAGSIAAGTLAAGTLATGTLAAGTLAAGTLAAETIAAPALAQSAPELKWRLTSSFPKSLDLMYGGAETFARTVAEMTDNRFQIQVFASGEIVPALQAADAVTNGVVELCQTCSYYFIGKDPTFAFGTAVPFGMNARQQNAWILQGGGGDLINEFYRGYNFVGLLAGNTGAQMGGWFRREPRTVADLSGLKMRVGGIAGRVLQKLGVVPQAIAGADLYAALEKGTLDAAEWVAPYDDEKLGLGRVAPYYYYPSWWEGGAAVHLFINDRKWAELPRAYQRICEAAAQVANAEMQAKYDARNPGALKRLVQGGAQLRPFSADIMEACLKAANQLYAETSAQNAAFKKVYDSYAAFRNDEYLWFQVAEYTYDNFMIRQLARG